MKSQQHGQNTPDINMITPEASVASTPSESEDSKLLSFIEWNTDTRFCNLNQLLAQTQTNSKYSTPLERTINLLGHKNPKLRILELGNGRDNITRLILRALKSQYGESLYLSYTYAATTPEASDRACELFQKNHNVDVSFYNAGGSSQSQNFKAGGYDLIITTDVGPPSIPHYEFSMTLEVFFPRERSECVYKSTENSHPSVWAHCYARRSSRFVI